MKDKNLDLYIYSLENKSGFMLIDKKNSSECYRYEASNKTLPTDEQAEELGNILKQIFKKYLKELINHDSL